MEQMVELSVPQSHLHARKAEEYVEEAVAGRHQRSQWCL